MLSHETGFFIWEVIIFVILLIVLKRMAWMPLHTYLGDKRKLISGSLDSAEMLRQEVNQLNIEKEVLRANVQKEILAIQIFTKAQIENIILAAEMKSKVEHELMIADAGYYIQKLKFDAINDIKNKTGMLVVKITEDILRKELFERENQETHILCLIKNLNFN